MQLGAIVAEIDIALARSGKNGGTVGGPQSRDVALRCGSCRQQILSLQMHIVKQVDDKAVGHLRRSDGRNSRRSRGRGCRYGGLLGRRGRAAGLLHSKMFDDLRFAVIEKPEILFVERADGVALGVANYSPYQHQPDTHPEGSWSIMRSHLGGVLVRRGGGGGVRRRGLRGRGGLRRGGGGSGTGSRLGKCHAK